MWRQHDSVAPVQWRWLDWRSRVMERLFGESDTSERAAARAPSHTRTRVLHRTVYSLLFSIVKYTCMKHTCLSKCKTTNAY